MSNPAYKPSEGKREEFRKYLEKNGVMDALTKVLVNLYEEVDKPEDALEFIRDKLAEQAGLETLNQMKTKCEELQSRVTELETELEQIKVAHAAEGGEGPPGEEGGEQRASMAAEPARTSMAAPADQPTGEQDAPQESEAPAPE